jgi:uncharacterized protein YjiS (DUF1127 family)
MEVIMSAILSAKAAAQDMAGQFQSAGIVAALKRWCAAYIRWRIEQAAIAHLWAMSDRELNDIGLTRGDLPRLVTRRTTKERSFVLKLF